MHRCFTRMKTLGTNLRAVKNISKQMNIFDQIYITCPGRIIFDMFLLFFRHDRAFHGKGELTLDAVSQRYLQNAVKETVSYDEIEK